MLFIAWIKKLLGIRSPSGIARGFEYEYDLMLAECKDNRERFNGECPYNGKPCKSFKCYKCGAERRERKWLKKL